MAKTKEPVDTPLWEKLVGLAGFVLLSSAIGILMYGAFFGVASSPQITIEVTNIVVDDNGFRVDVDVINSGEATAADLEIEAYATRPDGSREVSTLRFNYVPEKSRRTGGLFFVTDPGNGNLEIRPKSFTQP